MIGWPKKPKDLPDWKYGVILKNGNFRVMFVRFDHEYGKTHAGGAVQFLGIRLQNSDLRLDALSQGELDRFPLPFWKVVES